MSTPILATKLYVPAPRSNVVLRPRLFERLNEGLDRKLTLVSAPAGFGKTTLVSEYCSRQNSPVAWLSLEERDSNPERFLAYLVAALQTIMPQLGEGVLVALESPQPPPIDATLTVLLNNIAETSNDFILVLDDYHSMDAAPIDRAVTFLLEHAPPRMHLIITTRQDPQLPLALLRARDQLTELRAADLRFTSSEAAEFLNRVMGLNLSAQEIAALESRTEGWIVGLQLAALAMASAGSKPGAQDRASFIQSFTGSHRFVLDYLLDQVLLQQTEQLQTFLLHTSILDRLCGPLCDAVLDSPAGSGTEILSFLERANLFLFPLDNERYWYRYHHLFADLLRQRLQQKSAALSLGTGGVTELHQRASVWYENNGLVFEAFYHAAQAHDVERAERLIKSNRLPLHFPGAVRTILDWLDSLPKAVLDVRPALWARSASLSLVAGITTGVDEKLDAADAALERTGLVPGGIDGPSAGAREIIGQIAGARATLAMTRYRLDTSIAQARRALEYLAPDSFSFRASALWTLGVAQFLAGDRIASRRAFTDALAFGERAGNTFSILLATIGLGMIQELDNELGAAMETYRRALQLAGEPALTIVFDAHLGMARIFYEWDDLEAAQRHGESSLELARQYDRVIDQYIVCEVFLSRLKLAQGDVDGAAAMLARTAQVARERNFVLRIPEIAGAQVLTLLRQGNLPAAAQVTVRHDLPMIQARVHLAQGNASAALAILEPLRQLLQAKGWQDEQLKVMVLQAIALDAQGERAGALQLLADALLMAEPGRFIRLFVDEGEPMRMLLLDSRLWLEKQSGPYNPILGSYAEKLIAAFARPSTTAQLEPGNSGSNLVEPLSERELEILQLIAQGLSNQEIGERLFIALDTVKGHNRRIFDKLQVHRRTEAVSRARELGLV